MRTKATITMCLFAVLVLGSAQFAIAKKPQQPIAWKGTYTGWFESSEHGSPHRVHYYTIEINFQNSIYAIAGNINAQFGGSWVELTGTIDNDLITFIGKLPNGVDMLLGTGKRNTKTGETMFQLQCSEGWSAKGSLAREEL